MSFLDFTNHEFSSGGAPLEDGFHKGTVVSATQTVSPSRGTPQIEFKVKLEGGAVRTEWIGLPSSPTDKVMYVWERALRSCGFSEEKLKAAGRLPFDQLPTLFNGRAAHFEYKAGNKDLGIYQVFKFVTPAVYEAGIKKAATAPAPAAAAAPSLAAPTKVEVSLPPVNSVTPPAAASSSDALASLLN